MFRHSGVTLLGCLRLRRFVSPTLPTGLHRTQSASQFKRNANPFDAKKLAPIQSKLSENRSLSADEWQTLRSEMLASGDRLITEVNIDATILGRCLPDGQLELGISYVRFLRDTGREPNLASIGRLLRLYHKGEEEGKLTDADREDIVQICDDLQAKSDTYDSITSENMVHAIVATRAWRQALPLLESIKLSAKPSTSAYSLVAARAFRENAPEIGWQMLQECVATERIPRCEVYVAYVRMCEQQYRTSAADCLEALTKMLKFIGQNGLMVSQVVVAELTRAFETLDHQCSVVHIKENGHCPACHKPLQSIFLTNKEFQQLSAVFLDRVLVRNDVFVKSSPAEVAKFEQFLAAQAPFDCVIDGLNVAFSSGNQKSPLHYAKLLAAVVRHFAADGQRRVLVLGRKHMLKWPKSSMGYVHSNANLFLADDLSQDDPFLLYATLKSGPATDFVSRDLMRGHAHLLGPELKAVFRRWQQEHQFHLEIGSRPGHVNIREPIKFQTNAHTACGSWHVPFVDAYNPSPSDTFTLPSSWLCIAPSTLA